jgi:hypothetical protein
MNSEFKTNCSSQSMMKDSCDEKNMQELLTGQQIAGTKKYSCELSKIFGVSE